MNKTTLGQVFTPPNIVKKMIDLITFPNPTLILEPSSGDGQFYYPLKQHFKHVIGVEIDPHVAHQDAVIKSYFATNYHADVIIGNPPYVDFKNISAIPSNTVLKYKPNLYLFFLEKALNDLNPHGELIFIVPTTVFTSSSSSALNKLIMEQFSIVYYEVIPENVWKDACVSTAIIKIVKEPNHRDKLPYFSAQNKIIFGNKPTLNTKFEIKVGGASGKNKQVANGTVPFVVSTTIKDHQLHNLKYDNSWIRKVPMPRTRWTYQIFVNCVTRKNHPFYYLDGYKETFLNYDASVLCLFVNCDEPKLKQIINQLNNIDWKQMGVLINGRYHFSQSLLDGILNEHAGLYH